MTISLVQFIIEGGNAEIEGHASSGIDLKRLKRATVVADLELSLKAMNEAFAEMFGHELWSDELLKSHRLMSGSTLHLFNRGIPDAEFVSKKPSVGDIDLMVDERMKGEIVQFLNLMKGHTLGKLRLLAHKPSAGTQITLWELGDIVVQLDFEFVDFENGEPTEWSRFSRSSDWADISIGVKGAMHKLLMRSLMSKDKVAMLVKLKTKYKEELSSEWALSPTGMRRRYEPTEEMIGGRRVYKRLEGDYVRDLNSIFKQVFGTEPTPDELRELWTFGGMCSLVARHFTPAERRKTVRAFLDLLFGDGAQGLYRGNPARDRSEKLAAIAQMRARGLPVERGELDRLMKEYYKNYR
jgi:hypothetical protein